MVIVVIFTFNSAKRPFIFENGYNVLYYISCRHISLGIRIV